MAARAAPTTPADLTDEECGAEDAVDGALSATPSSSSECGGSSGGSSVEAPTTRPRRVAKRSIGEPSPRWQGWPSSPARKRLKSGSPTASMTSLTASCCPPEQVGTDACVLLMRGGDSARLSEHLSDPQEYDKFWQLVGRIATTPLCGHRGHHANGEPFCWAPVTWAPSWTPVRVRTDDCERLCGDVLDNDDGVVLDGDDLQDDDVDDDDDDLEVAAESPSRPSLSSQIPKTATPNIESTGPRSAPDSLSTPHGAGEFRKSVILAVPDEEPEAHDDVHLEVRQILVGPGPSEEEHGAELQPLPRRSWTAKQQQGPHEAGDPSCRRPRELEDRLQRLTSSSLPLCDALGEHDKAADVEEDSSVLQLLVLTPTEERKHLGPGRPGVGPAGGPCLRGAAGGIAGLAGGTAKCWKGLVGLLRRAPFFFVLLGLVQVSLFAAPTPYGAQEMKNMFVWNSSRLFQQPWRLLSYSMLHSGQMHVALNVGVQTIVGAPLEREQGALRVAGVYFGGALFGALVTGVVSPSLLMVGASAGIYSILMSHLAQIMLNPGTVRYGKTRAGAVLLLTSADMVYTAHHALQRGNAAPRIGVTAHCAGAVSGLFLGLALYRGAARRNDARDAPNDAGDACWSGRCLRRATRLGSSLLLGVTTVFSLVWIFVTQEHKS